jgi:negative regulator of flagellin synthesis FlgM
MAIGNIKNQAGAPPNLPSAANAPGKLSSEGAESLGANAASMPLVASSSAANAAKAAKALAGYEKVSKTSASVKDAANVQISQKAKDLNLIKKTMSETPDVREDKIAHFKELIASGKYKPDSGKIADGILKEALMDDLAKTPDVALED